MKNNFEKNILREAIQICEDSTVYSHIDRDERREAVSYIYNLLTMKDRPIYVAEPDRSV